MQKSLPPNYEIKELSDEQFAPLWRKYAPLIFGDKSQIFRLYESLDDSERKQAASLTALMGSPFKLNLAINYDGHFVGWCAGHQESAETFYMRNSAILPEHRRRGLYSVLLSECIRRVIEKGFQKIYSRHSLTNNEIIISKLKSGFTIASIEISDTFGALVHLVYFPKALRKKMMVYRVGDLKPDAEIKRLLKI